MDGGRTEGEGRRWYVRNVPGADNPFPLGAGWVLGRAHRSGPCPGAAWQGETEGASETHRPGSWAGEGWGEP